MKKSTYHIATVFSILLVLITGSITVNASSSFQPSSWSAERIAICEKAGIIPEDFDKLPFTDNITRMDFCELLVNTCRIYGVALPGLPETHPFTDTTDAIAEYSYMLGLTQGTAQGIFSPELPLTREMAAAMLSRLRILFKSATGEDNKTIKLSTNPDTQESNYGSVYLTKAGTLAYTQPMGEEEAGKILKEYSTDNNMISPWAKVYMADVYSLGILSGTGGGRLDPSSNILREQAAILSLNILAYYEDLQLQTAGVEECVIPKPTGIYISPSYEADEIFLRWNAIPSASAYDIEILKDGVPSYTARISSNFLDLRKDSQPSRGATDRTQPSYNTIFGDDRQNINATLRVTPVNSSGEASIFFLQQDFDIASWINDNEMITGDPNRNQFADISEANRNMTDITVNVWNLTEAGSKKTSTLTFKINKNVAETVKKIFEDIYNGKEKFPIKSIIGYSYRDGKSQHSNGTAIDINPDENYFISSAGSIIAGKLWKPGVNPYSIPAGGDVVKAFNRYGWHWSPDMHWPNGRDYMHFSLVGR